MHHSFIQKMKGEFWMKWNPHYEVREEHAFLSPSKYHWLNYDLQKLKTTFDNFKMSELGTRLHAFASECIELNQSLPKSKLEDLIKFMQHEFSFFEVFNIHNSFYNNLKYLIKFA